MRLLIPVFVGAIIGYFTNWLAIKMLFRPHEEKKIFGLKLPFTPGLIPKEKDRIAKSIGDAVGEHLLSPETIVDALGNRETEDKIKHMLYEIIVKQKSNSNSLKVYLSKTFGEAYDGLLDKLNKKLGSILISQIRKKEIKEQIYQFIGDQIDNIRLDDLTRSLNETIEKYLKELVGSEELRLGIVDRIEKGLGSLLDDDRTLSQFLTRDDLDCIFDYIDRNKSDLGNILRASFEDPLMKKKLKEAISHLIYKNVSRLITTFISEDMIAERVFTMIEEYIGSEDADTLAVEFVKASLDNILALSLSQVSSKIHNNLNDEQILAIVDKIVGLIDSSHNYKLILNSLNNALEKREVENKELIHFYLINKLDSYLTSEEIELIVASLVEKVTDNFLNKSISSFIEEIDEKKIDEAYRYANPIFRGFAENQLPKMIEVFDIAKVVEDKIQSFDTDFTEKLILDIAHKELKAITNLGALLGGIMGLLTPFLQMLY